ncbi:hypothetical protein, partial [Klebsiella pneumoniae]
TTLSDASDYDQTVHAVRLPFNSVHTVRGLDGRSGRKMMRAASWLIRRQDDLFTQGNNHRPFLPG